MKISKDILDKLSKLSDKELEKILKSFTEENVEESLYIKNINKNYKQKGDWKDAQSETYIWQKSIARRYVQPKGIKKRNVWNIRHYIFWITTGT